MNEVDAREACRDWWMKEALDVLVERLSSPINQPKENKTISISIETMCWWFAKKISADCDGSLWTSGSL